MKTSHRTSISACAGISRDAGLRRIRKIASGLILTLMMLGGDAQVTADHLFPGSNQGALTVATGIPYLGIVEYAYGLSDRFAIGAAIGVTPVTLGWGVRVRGILYQPNETFRVSLRSTMLYYPQDFKKVREPWLLAWQALSAEWQMPSGARWTAGVGLVGAACVDEIFGPRHSHGAPVDHAAHGHAEGHLLEDHGHHEVASGETEMMSGLWNTVHIGYAAPLSDKIVLHTEASLVMNGLRVAGDDWIAGPPVILIMGVTYRF